MAKEEFEYQPTFDALAAANGGRGPNAQELVDMGLAVPTEESISIVQGILRAAKDKNHIIQQSEEVNNG